METAVVDLLQRTVLLADRQLALVDAMEREQDDPEILRSLYGMDHVATLIRRQVTSLLTIIDPEALRLPQESLPLHDVLHASMAGVEDYLRVLIDDTAPVAVRGTVAPDVVLVITEVLEHVLAQAPGQTLLVTSWSASDGTVVEVRGGAPVPVDSPPACGPADRGLMLADWLARRHGLHVVLGGSGVPALAGIHLPRTVLADRDLAVSSPSRELAGPKHRAS